MNINKILEICLPINSDVVLFLTKYEFEELVEHLEINHNPNMIVCRDRISLYDCEIWCVTDNTWRNRLCGIVVSGVFISSKYNTLYPISNDEVYWLKTRCRGENSFGLVII